MKSAVFHQTLVDEDTNLILTDDTNRAIPGNLAMQVTPPDDKMWNQYMYKWQVQVQVAVYYTMCHIPLARTHL